PRRGSRTRSASRRGRSVRRWRGSSCSASSSAPRSGCDAHGGEHEAVRGDPGPGRRCARMAGMSTHPAMEQDDEIVEAFAAHLRLERGRSEHTVRAYRRETGSLLTHLREVERIAPAELDVTALRSWLAARA